MDKGDEDAIGKCHICRDTKPISYCEFCGHHFCASCRDSWFPRGLAFIKELVAGPTLGCCGPQKEEEEINVEG